MGRVDLGVQLGRSALRVPELLGEVEGVERLLLGEGLLGGRGGGAGSAPRSRGEFLALTGVTR